MRLELPTHRLQSWLLNQLDDLLRDRQTDRLSMCIKKVLKFFVSIIVADFKLLVEVPKQSLFANIIDNKLPLGSKQETELAFFQLRARTKSESYGE